MDLKQAAEQIKSIVAAADAELIGREAMVRSCGARKYKDRLGRIYGAIPDHHYGLRVLVMIYAVGTKDILNSKPETRTYWPLEEIEVLS